MIIPGFHNNGRQYMFVSVKTEGLLDLEVLRGWAVFSFRCVFCGGGPEGRLPHQTLTSWLLAP